MPSLMNDYVQVLRKGVLSYGGSQMWSSKETMRICGCGAVAAFDACLYLSGRQKEHMTDEEYLRELEAVSRRYFPLIKPFGINGLLLAVGMNRLLRKNKLPYRAFWAVSGKKFWSRIEELLSQDIPVIFSIGPNFPALWGKHRLRFYKKRPDGSYVPSSSAIAHYVTATGCDADWLRISSWGSEYYIKRSEYDEYVRRYSASLVSNILMLRKTG